MKTTKFLLAACILAGFSSSGIAQNVEVKTDTVGKQVRKTVKMGVKSAEDLLKLFGGANVKVSNDNGNAKKQSKVATLSPEERPMESNGDKKLYAKSYLNRAAPELVVEKWLTDVPDTEGKLVLIDFWGPLCSPCRKSIPDLNKFSKQFKDKLVVIGVSLNKEEHIRAMKEPVIEYYSAIDTKKEYIGKFEIKGYPHAILLDTRGIVRWEGNPVQSGHELTAEVLEHLITKYDYEDGGVHRSYSKSYLNEKAPELSMREWFPKEPDLKGKFVLRDFFSFHCGPCRKAIPKLNKWNKEFAGELVIIGCAKDGIARLRTIEPKIEYTLASDPQGKIWQEMDLHVLSYVQLIDPKGIVRWEGLCIDLTTKKIKEIIAKYK